VLAAILLENRDVIGSNIKLAALVNQRLGVDGVTPAEISRAKGLAAIKRIVKGVRDGHEGQSPQPRQPHADICSQELGEIYKRNRDVFRRDREAAVLLKRALERKIPQEARPKVTASLVSRLKRTKRLAPVREELHIATGQGSRKRWSTEELLAALRILNRGTKGSSFRARIRRGFSAADLNEKLPGRNWMAVCAKLSKLYQEGALLMDEASSEFYFAPGAEGVTRQPAVRTRQIFNSRYILQVLDRLSAEIGEGNPQEIADAIRLETRRGVTADQVASALRSLRFLAFRRNGGL
jgi:hypothetical protein